MSDDQPTLHDLQRQAIQEFRRANNARQEAEAAVTWDHGQALMRVSAVLRAEQAVQEEQYQQQMSVAETIYAAETHAIDDWLERVRQTGQSRWEAASSRLQEAEKLLQAVGLAKLWPPPSALPAIKVKPHDAEARFYASVDAVERGVDQTAGAVEIWRQTKAAEEAALAAAAAETARRKAESDAKTARQNAEAAEVARGKAQAEALALQRAAQVAKAEQITALGVAAAAETARREAEDARQAGESALQAARRSNRQRAGFVLAAIALAIAMAVGWWISANNARQELAYYVQSVDDAFAQANSAQNELAQAVQRADSAEAAASAQADAMGAAVESAQTVIDQATAQASGVHATFTAQAEAVEVQRRTAQDTIATATRQAEADQVLATGQSKLAESRMATAQAAIESATKQAGVINATATRQASESRATSTAQSARATALMATATRLAATEAAVISAQAAQLHRATGLDFVYVPEGEFKMGSPDGVGYDDEHPQHTIYLDEYWIGRTEVTNAQYGRFVNAEGYSEQDFWSVDGWAWRQENDATAPRCWEDSNLNQPDQPVVCVTWYEAEAYTKWLSEQNDITVTLPSEAQWEKAARGIAGYIYPWGNAEPNDNLLNYNDPEGKPVAVGSYPAGASPYDALDMAGNVWEWTADWFNENYYSESPLANPPGAEQGDFRILRGGAYWSAATDVRGAYRYWDFPDLWYWYVGFRVAALSPGF
jgi:formylglycine-generating enzyme required for sulfatase activity